MPRVLADRRAFDRRHGVRRQEEVAAYADVATMLSAREVEVAGLIARGYTNRQIAAALVIGEDTVKKHVSHALAKLGLHNRTELALTAAQLSGRAERLT